MKKNFSAAILGAFLLWPHFAQAKNWIETYSECNHSVENSPNHIRQTSAYFDSYPNKPTPMLRALKAKYGNTEHILGTKDGHRGVYLLPGKTAIFLPLNGQADKSVRENDIHLSSDEYHFALDQPGQPTVYVNVRIDPSQANGITTVSLSEVPFDTGYHHVSAEGAFDDQLRKQFKSALAARIGGLADAQRQNVADIAELNQMLGDGESRATRERGRAPYKPVSAEEMQAKLNVCRRDFLNSEKEDLPIRDAIVKAGTELDQNARNGVTTKRVRTAQPGGTAD